VKVKKATHGGPGAPEFHPPMIEIARQRQQSRQKKKIVSPRKPKSRFQTRSIKKKKKKKKNPR